MSLGNLWAIKKLYDAITEARRHPARLRTPGTWLALFRKAWAVEEVRLMLAGYKTYIVAALMGLVIFAHGVGYIDDATRDTLLGVLGAGAVGTVAAKINRQAKS